MYSVNMPTLRIPLLGRVSTGPPIAVPDSDFLLMDANDSIEISADLLPPGVSPRDLFALELQGSGMVDAGLYECDIVVLQPVASWADGDIVVVWLPDWSSAVLTRLYRDGEGYRLQAANTAMKPILIGAASRLEVKGKVVAMIRTIRD